MANRLTEIRKRRGLTQEQLAERVGTTDATINRLENNKRDSLGKWTPRLAMALDVEPEELISRMPLRTVPLRAVIRSAFSQKQPDEQEANGHAVIERVHAPLDLAAPDECFAARVADDSADRLYPRGSLLFVRATDALDGRLRPNAKIVVRHFAAEGPRRVPVETLVGLLGISPAGELMLHTRTTLRSMPAAIMIRPAPVRPGFSERAMTFAGNADEPVDYEPQPDDACEILGVVAMATTPE